MLGTRILTAIVLLAVFFPALLYLPPIAWAICAALLAALAAWEWAGLMQHSARNRVGFGLFFGIGCVFLAIFIPEVVNVHGGDGMLRWVYLPSLLLWLLVVPLWLHYRWLLPRSIAGFAIGVLVIMPTWLALIQLRQLGAWLLLAVMSAVWLADIAAYFFGRLLGKHKLAPSISPGKTWEGAIGGTLAVVIYGLLFSDLFPKKLAISPLVLTGMLLLFSALSIMGDLFESLLKRQASIKDSSNLLPGHGGVLDRIDSLTSTLPVVACVWFFLLD